MQRSKYRSAQIRVHFGTVTPAEAGVQAYAEILLRKGVAPIGFAEMDLYKELENA